MGTLRRSSNKRRRVLAEEGSERLVLVLVLLDVGEMSDKFHGLLFVARVAMNAASVVGVVVLVERVVAVDRRVLLLFLQVAVAVRYAIRVDVARLPGALCMLELNENGR